jgi:AraC family transcriptional regulator
MEHLKAIQPWEEQGKEISRFLNKDGSIRIYSDKDISIVVPESRISFPEAGIHFHESYEFIVTNTLFPNTKLYNKSFSIPPSSIFPINSNQQHGPGRKIQDVSFTAILVNKNFMDSATSAMYKGENIEFRNKSYPINNELSMLMWLFAEEARTCQVGVEFVLKNIGLSICALLARCLDNNLSDNRNKLYEPIRDYKTQNINIKGLMDAMDFLRENYDKEYSLEHVARVAELSPYHFIRVFKEYTRKTPYEYLIDVKIEKAKELLRNSSHSVTEVCFLSGFSNPSHFSNVFKSKSGQTPSQYRNCKI